MNKRLLLTLPLAATLILAGCNPSSTGDSGNQAGEQNTGDAGNTGGDSGSGDSGNGGSNPGSGSGTPQPLTVYTDENWDASTDTFEDLTFFKGGIDMFAVKRTAKVGADDYTTLTGSELSKGLVTHRELSVDQLSSSHVRTAGFKFQHSAANNSTNDILVVTCTPGIWQNAMGPGTSPNLIPATLTFSLKSNPSETQELSLTLSSEPTYKNLVSCDAMDVYDGASSPDEVVVFIGGTQAYVDTSSGTPLISRRSAVTRLVMDFDRDGELEDNDPVVGPMVGGISHNTLYVAGGADIQALSVVSDTKALFLQRAGVNNELIDVDFSGSNVLVGSTNNAFAGSDGDMKISDMEAHIAFGNIPRVSLVSHDYTGVVTVDYDSMSPAFTKSTDADAQNCVDVITSDGQPNARLWCHNSTDEGKLLQFTY